MINFIFCAVIIVGVAGQCLAKNRVMCDEGCFTMDKVVRREVKKNYNLPTSLKSEAISKRRPLLLCFFMNILIDNLLTQFFHIPNRKMCLSKKILYQYFTLLGTASPPRVITQQ